MANQKTSSAKKENKKTTTTTKKAAAATAKSTTKAESSKPATKAQSTKTAARKSTAAANSKKSAQKSKAPLYAGIGGGVLLVAVVAGLLIWNATRVSYDGLIDKNDKLGEEIAAARADDSCQKVYDEANSEEVSVDDYDKAVKLCRDNVNKIDSTMQSIEKDNVIEKDEDVKAAYDDLKKTYDKVIPAKADYELSLDIYKAIHKSVVDAAKAAADEDSDKGIKEKISEIYDTYKGMADEFGKLNDDDAKEFSKNINDKLEKLAEVRDKADDSMSTNEQLKLGMDLQQALTEIESAAGESSRKVEAKAAKLDIANFGALEKSQQQFGEKVKQAKK